MTGNISKTTYPEMMDLQVTLRGADWPGEVRLTRFQYLDWTQLRTLYVPEDIEEDGVFFHAGCRYELPRHLAIDGKLYTRTTHNIYKKGV